MGHIALHTLENADGSVTYTPTNGSQTIVVGVNYPTEVPYRSDELPESTFIDVNLRPHNAVGMVKERHLESILKRTLQSLVRVEDMPRTMLQITLQITSVETDEDLPGGVKEGGQGETYLPTLANAVNASILGCLDAGVQMKQTAAAVLVGITADGPILEHPRVVEAKVCVSLHVFAFSATGEAILMESEGPFKMTDWTRAHDMAKMLVLENGEASLLSVLRQAVEAAAASKGKRGG